MTAGLGGDLATMIEPVLESMGYGLVDIEFGAGGLLRITIDVLDGSRAIQIEDCERVSHQLGHLFTVENVDYDRLEVSSPGLDRPLRTENDFVRFAGEKLTVRLRRPLAGRRSFTGVLLPAGIVRERAAAESVAVDAVSGAMSGEPGAVSAAGTLPPVDGAASSGQPEWILIWQDDPEPVGRRPARGKTGRAVARPRAAKTGRGAKAAGAQLTAGATPPLPSGQWMALSLDQIEKARLVPKLAF